MKNKLIITTLILAFVVSMLSCKKDPCKDVVCEPGTQCDGIGDCIALVDQKINVFAEFNIFDSYDIGNSFNISIDALSNLHSASVSVPNGDSFYKEYIMNDSISFSSRSGGSPLTEYIKSEEFMGEISINLKFDDPKRSTTNFSFDFNMDTLNAPVMDADKVNDELVVNWSESYNAQYTLITLRLFEASGSGYSDIVFETETTNSSNFSISNNTSGWLSSNIGFIENRSYQIIIKPSIRNNITKENINYYFISSSSDSKQFDW